MGWTLLKILYPLAMVPFTVSIWFVRTSVNKSYGLDSEDFLTIRIICFIASWAFWILSLISLIKRHRSFPLLWGGTVMISASLLLLPAPATSVNSTLLRSGLWLGLGAHLLLLVINDRCLPRTVKGEEKAGA
ncbi:MAG: hypothetical protein P1V20_02820 [Verrucomicrobiales bacterium]|nr:hypothetical protein [Verrucomicrobiales bacterium]